MIGLMALAAVAAADPVCTTTIAPPVPLAAWAMPGTASHGPLAPGRGLDVALRPARLIRFAVPPARPATGYAGIVRLAIATPGTYRIALASAAWIDVVAGGRAIASVGHAHGPACTGIRKLVDFPLEAGSYDIQIGGSPTARTRVLVVPAG